jgi:transposase-like protein
VHGNGHAGFGGRPAETDRWQHRHRAAGRPHSFRYAGRQHWQDIAKALKPVYTASTEAAAKQRFTEFAEAWGAR